MVKAQAKDLVTEARCAAFVGLLQDMAFSTGPHTATHALSDTPQLARRFKLSSCDASYLELALREGLPLATLDGDLRNAMRQTGVALVSRTVLARLYSVWSWVVGQGIEPVQLFHVLN